MRYLGRFLILGLLLTGCSGAPEDAPSVGTGGQEANKPMGRVAPTDPPTVSTPSSDPNVKTIVITTEPDLDLEKWGFDTTLQAWDSPGFDFKLQPDCWDSDVCVLITVSTTANSAYAAQTMMHSPRYFTIELVDNPEFYSETFTRQGTFCHEIGHVLGRPHVDYPSCMADTDGLFMPYPATADLEAVAEVPWIPGKFFGH